ncbi:2-dehydro-3-deoxygalactonokinase [Leucothrix pacifica]|uniref:2-keto-3-deoxy-galactonokinase n=1 Tax=Leucothrix pacifica TaxID=1247513 RepID=A0A317CBT8_9GAMM|nr:2-dehydro-3-deoxygalactonokinase [Leucothrix pacifica]PWQ96016.1 2-keto-3-deoxy-galactonokinase [Leucothrix pacifica]
MPQIEWIAVDWGTTHLRAYAMSADHQVLADAQSTDGMGSLAPDEFESALLQLISPWLPELGDIPVLACGMVGARQGWQEADYLNVPTEPVVPSNLTRVSSLDARIQVSILPGLCQTHEADVMRGEEVQIAGLLATQGAEFSSVCLPGTHSKWVRLAQGQVIRFSTFMTGEMFALLSEQSILRHGVNSNEWDDTAFLSAVEQAVAAPEQWLSGLFRIRAKGLLEQMPANTARAHLSGLLIGAELAATQSYWQGQRIALIGEDNLIEHYAAALQQLGIDSESFSPKTMTLAGLSDVYQALTKTRNSHVT